MKESDFSENNVLGIHILPVLGTCFLKNPVNFLKFHFSKVLVVPNPPPPFKWWKKTSKKKNKNVKDMLSTNTNNLSKFQTVRVKGITQ